MMTQTRQLHLLLIYLIIQLILIISILIIITTLLNSSPIIEKISILPKNPVPQQPIKILAHITSPQKITDAMLNYSTDAGKSWEKINEDTLFFPLSTDSSDKNLLDGLDILKTYFAFDSEYFYFKLETKGKINTATVIPYYYGIDISTKEKAIKLKENYYSFYFCSGCKQQFKTFEGAPEAGYITYGKKYIFGEQIVIGQEFIYSEKDRIKAEPIEIYANKNTLYFKIDRYIFKGKPDEYSVRFFTMSYEEIQRERHTGPLQYESFTTYFSKWGDSSPIIYIYPSSNYFMVGEEKNER